MLGISVNTKHLVVHQCYRLVYIIKETALELRDNMTSPEYSIYNTRDPTLLPAEISTSRMGLVLVTQRSDCRWRQLVCLG